MSTSILPLLFVLGGCAHAGAKAPDGPPTGSPRLPSPRATVYAHVAATPGDPVVATALAGLPWDEALAGAAAGVALQITAGLEVDAYALRWAAVTAAYPYPIVERSTARVAEDEVPEALVATARARAGSGHDVGLVRARDGKGDVWVLLVGQRRVDLGRIPREYGVGESLALADASFVVADPSGRVRTASRALTFDAAGEWLLQGRDAQGVIATMPLYVGVPTPEEPPILDDARGDALPAQARDLLGALYNWYGREPATFDPMLDSVARARLRALQEGEALPAVETQTRVVGYADRPAGSAECRAATVAACLDGMWWSPERRGVLVGGYPDVGVAAEAVEGGVLVVVVVAG